MNTKAGFGYRTSSQSRYGKRPKTKREVELPKVIYKKYWRQINRTTFVVHKNNQNTTFNEGFNESYVERIEWVTDTKDYTDITQAQIMSEYQKLRKQLVSINEQVVKALKKIEGRPQRLKTVERDTQKIIQVRQREIENNNYMLQMYRRQFSQLNKRSQFISAGNKYDIQQQITRTRQKIHKVRDKIKDLNKKTKIMGNSIVNNDDIFEQMRQLEVQKDTCHKRQIKLEQQIKHTEQGIENAHVKINGINDKFFQAERFFQDQFKQKQLLENQRKYNSELRNKKQLLDVNKRKSESIVHMKQLKYHQMLKQYEAQTQRSSKTVKLIGDVEIQILNSKNTMMSLEVNLQKLKDQKNQIKQKEKLRKKKEAEQSFYKDLHASSNQDSHDKQRSMGHILSPISIEDQLSPQKYKSKERSFQHDKNFESKELSIGLDKKESSSFKQSETVQIKRNSFGLELKQLGNDIKEISEIQQRATEKQKFKIDLSGVNEKISSINKNRDQKQDEYDDYFEQDL